MRSMTAFLRVGGKQLRLTYHFLILWTGEDYEVTIYHVHPDGLAEYISRFTGLESVANVESRVKHVLRMNLLDTIHDEVTYE